MKLHGYNTRHRIPCYGAEIAVGAGVGGGVAAGTGTAITGTALTAGAGTAIGSGLSVGAGGTLGSALTVGGASTLAAGGAVPAAGIAGGLAAGTALSAAPTILGSTGLASALSALSSLTGGLLNLSTPAGALKTGLSLASTGYEVAAAKEDADTKKFNAKIASQQERKKSEADVAQSQERARAVLAQNDVMAAARGVVGGSGSQVALQSKALLGQAADAADINFNSALRQQAFSAARRRGFIRSYGRAARYGLQAGIDSTDLIGGF